MKLSKKLSIRMEMKSMEQNKLSSYAEEKNKSAWKTIKYLKNYMKNMA